MLRIHLHNYIVDNGQSIKTISEIVVNSVSIVSQNSLKYFFVQLKSAMQTAIFKMRHFYIIQSKGLLI